jgi:DNA-binding transcriptional LysR family regulator
VKLELFTAPLRHICERLTRGWVKAANPNNVSAGIAAGSHRAGQENLIVRVTAARIFATSDLVSVLPQRVAEELITYRPLAIRPLPHSSPSIETAMIWPRWFDNQPAHRWLRQNIEFSAGDLHRR